MLEMLRTNQERGETSEDSLMPDLSKSIEMFIGEQRPRKAST